MMDKQNRNVSGICKTNDTESSRKEERIACLTDFKCHNGVPVQDGDNDARWRRP